MKKLFLFVPLILLFACSVQKRKYQNGYYVDWHPKHSKSEKNSVASARRTPVQVKKEEPVKETVFVSEELEKRKELYKVVTRMLAQDLAKAIHPKRLPEDTCDVMVFKDGSEVRGKIQEMGVSEIKYKRCDNPSGPLYTTKKSDLFMIRYSNGTREVIKSDPIQQRVQSPEPSQRNYRSQRYRKQVHPLAIAALVLACIAAVLGYMLLLLLMQGISAPLGVYLFDFLLAMVAIITGSNANSRIKQNPDVYKGKGMAIPGFIIGIVVVGIYAMLGLILLLVLGMI